MIKIAVLEDEPEWADAVVKACQKENWSCEWFTCVADAQNALSTKSFDCMIGDIHLGEAQVKGMDLVVKLRQTGNAIPILLLTQFASKYRAAASLDYGADDYLAKPFNGEELCARVRALLRRSSLGDPTSLKLGALEISRQYRSAFWHKDRVELRGQGFDILALLAEHEGRVVSHDMLWNGVWNKWERLPLQIQPIQAGISRLRRDIAAVTSAELLITVPGIGYRLNVV